MNYPTPSPRQLAWHELEYYCFIHFTINTFTDKEWGYGDESPELFNPTDFDAESIVQLVSEAGMKGLMLTCKHHDGFCLWPSQYTEHSVKNSPWKNGTGDIVREISDACKKYGVKFGVYLSPWDRNHPEYGTPAYIEYFRNQLVELTTHYGDVFEVWFDGANGGDGYYGGANEVRSIDRKTYYDWDTTREIIRKNQPHAVMFSDAGPDIRWVGNEDGIAGDPCWSTICSDLLYPGIDDEEFKTKINDDMVDAWDSPFELLNKGDRQGEIWMPAETDVSIRPGWFYHTSEDDKVRTPENLFDLYLKSVGRGTSLLLNLPPDRRGRIHENDARSLLGFKKMRDEMYSSNCIEAATLTTTATPVDGGLSGKGYLQGDASSLEVTGEFSTPCEIGIIGLREYLPRGQRADAWTIEVLQDGTWKKVAEGEAIGNRRLIPIPQGYYNGVRISITGEEVTLSDIGLYKAPEKQ